MQNKILANLIFLIHWPILYILLFGWSFEKFSWLYLTTLVITFITQAFFGYCLLTKWEFDLRKKIDPNLDYDYSFLSWYAYKYSNVRISSKLLEYLSLAFLLISIVIFLYSHVSI